MKGSSLSLTFLGWASRGPPAEEVWLHSGLLGVAYSIFYCFGAMAILEAYHGTLEDETELFLVWPPLPPALSTEPVFRRWQLNCSSVFAEDWNRIVSEHNTEHPASVTGWCRWHSAPWWHSGFLDQGFPNTGHSPMTYTMVSHPCTAVSIFLLLFSIDSLFFFLLSFK